MSSRIIVDAQDIYHLSLSGNGTVFGAGISKGNEGVTEEGDSIKAGRFPVLFFANKDSEYQHIKKRGNYYHKKTLKRVNGKRTASSSNQERCCNDSSSYAQETPKNV